MAPRNPQHTQRYQRRSRGFEATSKLVAQYLRGPAEKRGFSETKLLSKWREIVGEDLAKICEPVKLTHTRHTTLGNTLVVLATGAQAPLVAMQQEQILARVNACYGYRAVSKLRVTQTAPSGFAEGQAQIAAAQSLSADEQQAQIEGMVAMAAAKLADDPSNLDRWVMVMRSHSMLGNAAKAKATLEAAVAANPENEAGLREQARALGIQ